MAINHGDCVHPRTPAGRAACRRAGGPGVAMSEDGITPVDIDTEGDHPECPPRQPSLRKRQAKALREARTELALGTGTKRDRKAVSGQLKRPGTFLRATHDLADVPRRLTPAIRTAWDNGWYVRVGEPYNDTERRIELLAPYGVVSLVWKESLANGVWGVFWRNVGNPITRRIDNVNLAMRLAAGEEEL
jgi:hypothetical protein